MKILKICNTIYLLLVLLVAAGNITAQDDGFVISGTILDSISGQPVASANVLCDNCTTEGVMTNNLGEYTLIANVTGTTTLTFSHLLYRAQVKENRYTGATTLDFSVSPESVLLPEIVVSNKDANWYISTVLLALEQEAELVYDAKSFYRQTLKVDTTYQEFLESKGLAKVNSRHNLQWKVMEGRYAAIPGLDINFKDHSYISRGFQTYKRDYSPTGIVVPITKDAQHLYVYSIKGRISKPNEDVLIIQCSPSSTARGGMLIGDVYIGATSKKLYRSELVLYGYRPVSHGLTKIENASFKITTNYKKLNDGVTVMNDIRTNVFFTDKSTPTERNFYLSSILVNYDYQLSNKQKIKYKIKKTRQDRNKMISAKYNPDNWKEINFIPLTAFERLAVQYFEENDHIGNYTE